MDQDDEYSTALKGAAIYLYEKKGLTKLAISKKLDVPMSDLAAWLLNRQTIKNDLTDELTRHYMSDLS